MEQVKSGAKNKSEAFSELRSILNSSAGRGNGPTLKGDEEPGSSVDEVGVEEVHGQNFSTVNPPSRFTHEDRRMLINKLIEKKRRSEGEYSVSSQGQREISAPDLNEGEDQYNVSGEYQGEDENKWGNDSQHVRNQNGENNNFSDDYEGDREEKG